MDYASPMLGLRPVDVTVGKRRKVNEDPWWHTQ